MERKENAAAVAGGEKLRKIKRATALAFVGFFVELALLVLFAFGCVEGYKIKLLLKNTLGLIVFVLGMISVVVGGVVMIVVQIRTFLRSLSVKEEKDHLQAAAYWTNISGSSLGLFLFFIVYMLGVSIVSGGGLYATGVWIALFVCAFLVYAADFVFWKRVYGNGIKAAGLIELGYALLRFAIVLALVVLSANVNAADEIGRAWMLHDKLFHAYGLLELVEYALQAAFAMGGLALLFYLFGNEKNEVDGRKVLRKYTWAVAALTVVDCALYIFNALAVSSVWGAIGGWFAQARLFWIPVLFLVVALHVSHRFPAGEEVHADLSAVLRKQDIERAQAQMEQAEEKTKE